MKIKRIITAWRLFCAGKALVRKRRRLLRLYEAQISVCDPRMERAIQGFSRQCDQWLRLEEAYLQKYAKL